MVSYIRWATVRPRVVLAIAVLGVAYSASVASAADVTVGAGGCILANGGQATRPAGSTITIRWGVSEKNKGISVNYLHAQSTSIVVNGGQPVDVSDSYGVPTLQPDGTWVTFVSYPTGVTLANPGDTLTFSVDVSLAHPLAEVTNGLDGFTPGPPIFNPAGTYFSGTCTVTAV